VVQGGQFGDFRYLLRDKLARDFGPLVSGGFQFLHDKNGRDGGRAQEDADGGEFYGEFHCRTPCAINVLKKTGKRYVQLSFALVLSGKNARNVCPYGGNLLVKRHVPDIAQEVRLRIEIVLYAIPWKGKWIFFLGVAVCASAQVKRINRLLIFFLSAFFFLIILIQPHLRPQLNVCVEFVANCLQESFINIIKRKQQLQCFFVIIFLRTL
jgi:hypothetical protein